MRIMLLAFFILGIQQSRADNYHYREMLVGERAAGLGGAYIAISDDPSGLWYNPAGIIFSFENYFSLSANVFSATTEVYKSAVAGQDYKYISNGLVPSFFGFTQSMNKLKWGFAMIVSNDDRIDQDDQIANISSATGQSNALARKFYRQNTSTAIGMGLASEVAKNMTLGFSGFMVYHVDKQIDNQLITYNTDSGGREKYFFQDANSSHIIWSFLPKLGFQWMPKKELAMGATLAKKVTVKGEKSFKRYSNNFNSTTGQVTDPVGVLATDLPRTATTGSVNELSPIEVGFGISWFPRPSLLTTFDFVYYSDDPAYGEFKTIATWNISSGIEYFFSEKSALRFGFFTNNANTPVLADGGKNQLTHVDTMNFTFGYSHTSEGSSFSLGTQFGYGKGRGQAVGDVVTIQDVERTSVSFFLTGSYQM